MSFETNIPDFNQRKFGGNKKTVYKQKDNCNQ